MSILTNTSDHDFFSHISATGISRRTLLKTGGAATIGLIALGTSACGKNISIYTATVIGTLEELLPLLPNQNERLKRAISVAKTFDEAYRAGKFESAVEIFDNLDSIVREIIDNIGVMSDEVKTAIALGGVALHAIATIFKAQASQPKVAAAIAASGHLIARSTIERMADPKVLDAVMAAIHP